MVAGRRDLRPFYPFQYGGMRGFAKVLKQTGPKDEVSKDETEVAAMAGAKDFLDQAKSFVDELASVPEFTTKVMHCDKPVILHCYAE